MKWNVDGSSLGKPGLAGAGGVLRDNMGLVKCFFSISCGIIDSNLAELIVIRKALQLLVLNHELYYVKITTESDSLNSVIYINQVVDVLP